MLVHKALNPWTKETLMEFRSRERASQGNWSVNQIDGFRAPTFLKLCFLDPGAYFGPRGHFFRP